ncbi:MAG TPA: PhaM family polyhydroxyalkanoate granule multifunctional regulatory protein [Paenalcaligenes sp.]|nr:PhaM family polyhydroxyalkanoate granule multifunctional regulatory protein [Paenalcaligenes sp.]
MQQNPFQQFNIGTDNNPLLSSMESLRKAWANMPNNPLAPMSPLQMQSVEDLDKRITELQAVENWLALNLSMLRNTIQALEIQRSTLNTFQAFTQMQWPGGTRDDTSAAQDAAAQAAAQQAGADASADADAQDQQSQEDAETAQEKSGYEAFTGLDDQAIMQAGQAWWDLMQQQFQTLVQTTQSSAQAAQSATEQFQSEHSPRASGDSTLGKKTAQTTSSSGAQKTAKAAAKKAAKKSSSTKNPGAKKGSKVAKGAKKSAKKST